MIIITSDIVSIALTIEKVAKMYLTHHINMILSNLANTVSHRSWPPAKKKTLNLRRRMVVARLRSKLLAKTLQVVKQMLRKINKTRKVKT